MRPVEILLSFANLITFLVFVIPRSHTARWLLYAVFTTILIAVVQVLVEGPRWQMVPAYALTGVFLLVWLLQSYAPVSRNLQQLLTNKSVTGSAFILCIVGLVISAALPIVLPVFNFPQPRGPYEIGTLTYHWTDVSRQEVFSTNKNTPRELLVQIWYPAKKIALTSHTPYLENANLITSAVAQLHNLPDFVLNQVKYVTTNAFESVPVTNDKPSYRVLIYLEGLTGFRQMSTFQVEDLVSHGYIVVGIDQPGVAAAVVFPDGHQITGLSKAQMDPLTQQSVSPAENAPQLNGQEFKDGLIPYLAQDVSFTLDQLTSINNTAPRGVLTGKLDLQDIGMFGVSSGGIVGAEACLKDVRLKACLVMDAVMTADVVSSGLKQPSMWITRPAETMRLERQTAGGWTEKDIEQTQTTMRAVYKSLPGDGYFVQIPGAYHIDFTDLDLLSPIFPKVGFSGPIGSRRAHEIINAYSVAFFDKELKGVVTPLLEGHAKQFSEVILETRKP